MFYMLYQLYALALVCCLMRCGNVQGVSAHSVCGNGFTTSVKRAKEKPIRPYDGDKI